MFWFKNAQIYRLTKEIDFSNIEQTLQRCKFTECQVSDVSKLGWANPLITSEQLHFSVNGHILILAQKEEKILPTSVIKKETDTRISALEEKENRQLKKIAFGGIKEKEVIINDV